MKPLGTRLLKSFLILWATFLIPSCIDVDRPELGSTTTALTGGLDESIDISTDGLSVEADIGEDVDDVSAGGQSAGESGSGAPASGRRWEGEYRPDEILVTFRESYAESDCRRILRGQGHDVRRRLRFRTNPRSLLNRTYLVRIPPGRTVEEELDRIIRNPSVEAAQPNFIYHPLQFSGDPLVYLQWFHQNLGGNASFDSIPGVLTGDPRTVDTDIDSPEAGSELAAQQITPNHTVVAVIDTGVDWTHPDLSENIWSNPNEILNGIDDDGDGYTDDIRGWDFYGKDNNPMDEDSHGSHVAGVIAAVGDNGNGVSGIAQEVSIMALRFLGPNGGATADAADAVDYAVLHGASALNNSWGGGAVDATLQTAITDARNAGVLFVAAAGNDGTNNESYPHYPSDYTIDNILSVAASTAWRDRASFSNYSVNKVHIAAPGHEILSTTPPLVAGQPNDYYQITYWDDGWGEWLDWSGTSMATPMVTATAAILYGLGPYLEPSWNGMLPVQRMTWVRNRILDRAEVWPSLTGTIQGERHLNFFNTVEDDESSPAAAAIGLHFKTTTTIVVDWVAPGDDDLTGQANRYDLRYSQGSSFDFENATSAPGVWTPRPAGEIERYAFIDLLPDTEYRFALVTYDNAANVSPMSNVLAVVTEPLQILFQDDMESGSNGWTGDWGLTTTYSHSPTHSWTDSPGGNYPNNANLYLVSPEILANNQTVRLSYWQRYAIQSGKDYGYVQTRYYNGSTWSGWTTIHTVTGNNTSWHEVTLDLAETGEKIQVRFWLYSNRSTTYDGWYVDDVTIEVTSESTQIQLNPNSGFNNATGWDLVGSWEIVSGYLWDGYNTNYNDNIRASATTVPYDLSMASGGVASFSLVSSVYETSYDYLYWDYSLDGFNWRTLGQFTGNQSGTASWDMSILAGQPEVYFRFRSQSDFVYNYAGAQIDNFELWISEVSFVPCQYDTDCDDTNVCTTDTCNTGTGECENTFNTEPCDDGNACTVDDICSGGACTPGGPLVCNDGNVCTDDACDPGTGCYVTDNSEPCDDGNACTVDDICSGGACTPGAPLVCNDGNVCTDDACDPGTGCYVTDNSDPCDDGNACTVDDICSGGACTAGAPLVCNDGNVCTDDACDPGTGCYVTDNSDPCDDGSACTVDDICSAGACTPGSPLVCNDGNVCTDDSCDPGTGCYVTNNSDPCDDGNACTVYDLCMDGECSGGGSQDCNDWNVCTDDACDSLTGCYYTDNTNPCDDGQFCTATDLCTDGTCVGAGDQCPGEQCDEVSDLCVECLTVADCDDADECTEDDCISGICVHKDICPVAPYLWTGILTASTDSWTTVPLGRSYTEMVVVCTPNYTSSTIPLVTRIRNAAGDSFELSLSRTDDSTTAVSGIPVHCMVVEAGTYTTAEHGITMEAHTYVSTITDHRGSWVGDRMVYENTYADPVVLGQVMSYNDQDFSVFWCRGSKPRDPPSSTELYVGKHVGEDPDTTRAYELVGYVVFETGAGSMGAVQYTTALGPDTIRGVGSAPPYSYLISGVVSPQVAIANQAGMDGGNGSWAILYDPVLSRTDIFLAIDEDQNVDHERSHTTEQVAYIVFGSDLLSPESRRFSSDSSVPIRRGSQTDSDIPVCNETDFLIPFCLPWDIQHRQLRLPPRAY